jgi:hypothetical protein
MNFIGGPNKGTPGRLGTAEEAEAAGVQLLRFRLVRMLRRMVEQKKAASSLADEAP